MLPQHRVWVGGRVDDEYWAVVAEAAAGARVRQHGHVGPAPRGVNVQRRHPVGRADAGGKPARIDVLELGRSGRGRAAARIDARKHGRRPRAGKDRVRGAAGRRLQREDGAAGAEIGPCRGGRARPRAVHED